MAAFHPPEYHAHDCPASFSLSPIVGIVILGSNTLSLLSNSAGWGWLTEYSVLIAKPSGVYCLSYDFSLVACISLRILHGAFLYSGVAAAISQIWFKKEPPKAEWKKLSQR